MRKLNVLFFLLCVLGINLQAQVWQIDNVVTGGAAIVDENDLSASFEIEYDQDTMYLKVVVKDDVIVPWPGTGESYMYDNVEIFIDPSNAKARRYNEGPIPAQQLRVNVDPGKDDPNITMGANFIVSATQEVEDDVGYTLNIKINLAALQIAPEVGRKIGFDIAVGDNDDQTRESIIAWHNATGKDNSWQVPAYFGTIKFAADGTFEEVDVMPTIGEFDGVFFRADRRGIDKWTLGEATVVDNADFSGRHYVLWDENSLFIKVEVFDDSLVAYKGSGNTYEYDNIEVFLDMKNDKAGSYAEHHYQIRYNYGWDEISGSSNVTQMVKDGIKKAQQLMLDENDAVIGWILETEIPFSVLTGLDEVVSGAEIGFDISIADNDGTGRKAIKVWNNPTGSDNNWQNPQLFGALRLDPGAITSEVRDTEAPTKPENFAASEITQNTLILSWEASTDNWGVYRYHIYLGDSLITSTRNLQFTIINLDPNTEYEFTIKASDVSGNLSEEATLKVSTIPTNVEDLMQASMKIYPNPFNTSLNIESNIALKSVKVVSITGQVVINERLSDLSNVTLNTSALVKGVYFINLIDSEGKAWTQKLVK